ncbi:hypothetical protein DFP72DRAFT_861619 [Ephemerocybe angulata]|uniref:Uncharacterized protein n=1 Tax=Ephemerocybe angulata TaxID=980116 RepID=A0A8H6H8X1_9AGAR|nr:hypothetical protein DFP72DRAFT_861619 [Tulosesus angulatus]
MDHDSDRNLQVQIVNRDAVPEMDKDTRSRDLLYDPDAQQFDSKGTHVRTQAYTKSSIQNMAIEATHPADTIDSVPLSQAEQDLYVVNGIQPPLEGGDRILRRARIRFVNDGQGNIGYLPLSLTEVRRNANSYLELGLTHLAFKGEDISFSDAEEDSDSDMESESSDDDWIIREEDELDDSDYSDEDSTMESEDEDEDSSSMSQSIELSAGEGEEGDEDSEIDELSDCRSDMSVGSSFETWDGAPYLAKKSTHLPLPVSGKDLLRRANSTSQGLDTVLDPRDALMFSSMNAEPFFVAVDPKVLGSIQSADQYTTAASVFNPMVKKDACKSPLTQELRSTASVFPSKKAPNNRVKRLRKAGVGNNDEHWLMVDIAHVQLGKDANTEQELESARRSLPHSGSPNTRSAISWTRLTLIVWVKPSAELIILAGQYLGTIDRLVVFRTRALSTVCWQLNIETRYFFSTLHREEAHGTHILFSTAVQRDVGKTEMRVRAQRYFTRTTCYRSYASDAGFSASANIGHEIEREHQERNLNSAAMEDAGMREYESMDWTHLACTEKQWSLSPTLVGGRKRAAIYTPKGVGFVMLRKGSDRQDNDGGWAPSSKKRRGNWFKFCLKLVECRRELKRRRKGGRVVAAPTEESQSYHPVQTPPCLCAPQSTCPKGKRKARSPALNESKKVLQERNPNRWAAKGRLQQDMRATYAWIYILTKYGEDHPRQLLNSRVSYFSSKEVDEAPEVTPYRLRRHSFRRHARYSDEDLDELGLKDLLLTDRRLFDSLEEVQEMVYDLRYDIYGDKFQLQELDLQPVGSGTTPKRGFLEVSLTGSPFLGGSIDVLSPFLYLQKAIIRLQIRGDVTVGLAEVNSYTTGEKYDRKTHCPLPSTIYDSISYADLRGKSQSARLYFLLL